MNLNSINYYNPIIIPDRNLTSAYPNEQVDETRVDQEASFSCPFYMCDITFDLQNFYRSIDILLLSFFQM
jgi:hypothetical protein